MVLRFAIPVLTLLLFDGAAAQALSFSNQVIGSGIAPPPITIGAAYSIRPEEEVGSITSGTLADTTMLEPSPYDVPPGTLKDIPVSGTIHAGGVQEAPDPAAGTGPQMPNPAAVFCEANGGRHEIRDGADGQFGICILPDGREVDAWDYYREQHSDTGVAAPTRVAWDGNVRSKLALLAV